MQAIRFANTCSGKSVLRTPSRERITSGSCRRKGPPAKGPLHHGITKNYALFASFERRHSHLLAPVMKSSSTLQRLAGRSAAALAAALLACFAASDARAADARGKQLYVNCIACHGPEAEGNQMLNAPALAGLSEQHIVLQLQKFKQDIRGAHVDDATGMMMLPMAKVLRSEEEQKAVAAYIASLEAPTPEPTVEGGDPERGKALYAACAACHGPNAQGNDALNAPNLANQRDWYLVSQLKKFKEGIRGTHPEDITGAQMRPMAMTLADEQAIKDVVAYIRALAE